MVDNTTQTIFVAAINWLTWRPSGIMKILLVTPPPQKKKKNKEKKKP